jgi:hypothetical protein
VLHPTQEFPGCWQANLLLAYSVLEATLPRQWVENEPLNYPCNGLQLAALKIRFMEGEMGKKLPNPFPYQPFRSGAFANELILVKSVVLAKAYALFRIFRMLLWWSRLRTVFCGVRLVCFANDMRIWTL